MQDVSSKNTKTEILQAYEEMQKEIATLKRTSRKETQAVEKKRETVTQAVQNAPETLVQNLSNLKVHMNKFTNDLAEQVTNEFEKLNALQQAIEIEKENLKNYHEINANADTLEALLLAQKHKREEFDNEMQDKRNVFEEEMTQKRSQFKNEQSTFESLLKEEKDSLQKQRKREEDEYNYKLQTERQRNEDVYTIKKSALERELAEKKAAFEKSIAERETNLKAREAEFADLRKQVSEFPQTLESAVKQAEKNISDRLEMQYKYEFELRAKEYSGELKLSQQMVAALKDKIKEQEEYVSQLTQRAGQANTRAQEIAIKAIESSSSSRHLSTAFEQPLASNVKRDDSLKAN